MLEEPTFKNVGLKQGHRRGQLDRRQEEPTFKEAKF
jgi:hypothetical protein